ncbi:MAG TPA: M28 family peptidase [Bacteroidota bacterium]|nr:M28 family peptidase [Bacteroidota bacterium]
MHSIVFIGILFLHGTPAVAQEVTGRELMSYVQGIEGKSPEGRREFIKQQLRRFGVPFRTQSFDTTLTFGKRSLKVSGENILVRVGSGSRHIIVGAHLDAVPNSPGANDNGGGVAVLLGLIRDLKNSSWNTSVDFCFFDQEEMGLIGSAVYVKHYAERENHLAMINLDVEGMGDEVYVGPVGGGDDEFIMKYVEQAKQKTGYKVQAREFYPPSDWGSFAAAKLENISISVVPKGDVDLLAQAVKDNWQVDSTRIPVVLKTMHTPEDKSIHMSPDALKISFEFTKALILLLNNSRN